MINIPDPKQTKNPGEPVSEFDRREFLVISGLSAAGVAVDSRSAWAALANGAPPSGGMNGSALGHLAHLKKSFIVPPAAARPSCYWWWFYDLMDKHSISANLEEFKAKGMGGVMLVCTANGYGAGPMPSGPPFLSPQWLELFKHTLHEAARLDLELGVNFSGGWDMGGPWITPENAGRWFLQAEMTLDGPQHFHGPLAEPKPRNGYDSGPQGNVSQYIDLPIGAVDYRDSAVLAFREPAAGARLTDARKALLAAKSNRQDGDCFLSAAEVTVPVLQRWSSFPGDVPIKPNEVIDLSLHLDGKGNLEWEVPPGHWTILRTGHRMTGQRVCQSMPKSNPRDKEDILERVKHPDPDSSDGWEIDWLGSGGVDQQWEHLGKVLLAEAGDMTGRTLKYFAMDSFEDGYPNWTEKLIEDFVRYRGYDPKPFLPVFAGYLVGSAELSDRFLYDYRKTVADCMADNVYGHFAELSHSSGMAIQCEAAGPSWSGTMCMDGLKNLGRCDMPQGEFWNGTFVIEGQNKVCKQTASAAHIYGKRTASAEAFTSGKPHWSESPATLKPLVDVAFCEGINRCVFHTMTATRLQDGMPGFEYGAGTHFNPNVTWWKLGAESWITYVSRCQTLLQTGKFVADVIYYNGDWAPNIVEPKHVDPSLGRGYDYDVCNSEVLLTRTSVESGRIVLPDGMAYHLLVLPEERQMTVEIIRKIHKLVSAGATVVGPKPQSDPGLHDYPRCDEVVSELADRLWGAVDEGRTYEHRYGRGRVISGRSLREILNEKGVKPDFEVAGADPSTFIDFIHRSFLETEIYFLVNRNDRLETVSCRFRVSGRHPELWDPVTGRTFALPILEEKADCTCIKLQFYPHQSLFVVFGCEMKSPPPHSDERILGETVMQVVNGPWDVNFDPEWFYPVHGLNDQKASGKVRFDSLEDWCSSEQESIRFYSGAATYQTTFDAQFSLADNPRSRLFRLFLDLGVVKEIASARLNGVDLGTIWCEPWRVDITGILQSKSNRLEIEVVNLWPNRLIGDAGLSNNQRRTETNIASYNRDCSLLPSGLLGPVRIVEFQSL